MDDNFAMLLLKEILWYGLRAFVLISFSTYIYLKIFKGVVWGYNYNDFWYMFLVSGILTLFIQFFIRKD